MKNSYLANNVSSPYDKFDAVVVNHGDSTTYIYYSDVMAPASSAYMAWKSSGTLVIYYSSKKGTTAGSPTVQTA